MRFLAHLLAVLLSLLQLTPMRRLLKRLHLLKFVTSWEEISSLEDLMEC